ncbi:TetR/AcrR family transcriptional regulator C-terminal domain-containing protein [Leifsonia sp. NPDC058292]|uniref:TetR/AcrR family transcriptional regulator C-terminal domain-containing protein n=1 Tax=Leifsonia sp. NPDC058292 TaxID=3346428 RepID=UPI0036DF5D03
MAVRETANSRPARHSRDDVAQAALRILDDFGLPDLTMRRLAASLDVQPSALYWHFPNKQTLLAEISDRIVSHNRAALRDDAEWSDRVRAEAAGLRDSLLAFRDGAEVVSSTFALGLGATAPLDRLTSAIESGGFDPETARRAAVALVHFVLGHVSHEQQRMQYDSLGVVADHASVAATGAEVGAAPGSGESPAEDFQFGVSLFVGGLERLAVAH